MAAIWFLAAVTMQRAWVVLCISKGKQNRITKAGTMMVTMGIWVAALATSIAPLLGWNNYVYEVKTRKKIFIFGLRNVRTINLNKFAKLRGIRITIMLFQV